MTAEPTVTWRVQLFRREATDRPCIAAGAWDFPSEAAANAFLDREKAQIGNRQVYPRIGPDWRAELQRITVETVGDTGYREETP